MSIKVIMFPGQGSQYKGMGEQLFKEYPEAVKTANKALGYDIAELCLIDPENKLNQTNYTQPALYFVNYLNYQKYLASNDAPNYFIGHSLGEFNALNAAGVYDFETGLKIVQKRGELMFSVGGTSMAAVIGGDYKEIKEILKNNFPDIDIANINTMSQIVISGKTESLNKAADFFEEEGMVYIPLKVSGAFHSRYMTPVKQQFHDFIESMTLKFCITPVISNYTAAVYPLEREAIIKNMINQIDSPIKWLQSVEYLMYQGECDFIEIGASEVLTNIVKKISI
ncbi:ACP S-malonyltransferase [Aurantibacillus circumpalustris]|uniref:ACP S-malonyltransferase n=1 Tax=Aurantibacillus circumpalustris TaxID=3036359 RepID=UPI00295A8B62|nr:ACP S-malonyltransferase [Aurantibacillus circumpalustris]